MFLSSSTSPSFYESLITLRCKHSIILRCNVKSANTEIWTKLVNFMWLIDTTERKSSRILSHAKLFHMQSCPSKKLKHDDYLVDCPLPDYLIAKWQMI